MKYAGGTEVMYNPRKSPTLVCDKDSAFGVVKP